jgi:hypothetical protein
VRTDVPGTAYYSVYLEKPSTQRTQGKTREEQKKNKRRTKEERKKNKKIAGHSSQNL